MANPDQLAILKQGLEAWNKWRKEHPDAEIDLAEAYLSNADLSIADLRDADLGGADLSDANLHMANLYAANLNEADLSVANLAAADLTEVNLSGADLRSADLSRATLSGTFLYECTLAFTVFGDLDLSTAEGLETADHRAPSTIGIDTIYKSKGKIPETFLRGAGVPENFITYMHSLTGQAFEF